MSAALYTGEDVTITIDLVDNKLSELSDIVVGVAINEVLKVTFKKTSSTVFAVDGEPNQCYVKLTRAVTQNWVAGMLSMEITKVFSDSDYPSGKHVIFKDNIVEFLNAYTKNV